MSQTYKFPELKTHQNLPHQILQRLKFSYNILASSVFTVEQPNENMPLFQKRVFEKEIDSIDISEDMVRKKLLKLKVNKSPGPDAIHPRVLHEIAEEISKPLTIILRSSLKNRKLPDQWKHANVSSIHKKDSETLPPNYRPVSLTSVACKIMEGVIRHHIIYHMKINKMFSDKQFGFISGRSTTLQLLSVLTMWSEILDEGGTIETIYCDFMKAFDKVPHQKLLYKIEKYGIVGDLHGWIESFLKDRTHCVIINNTTSSKAPVTSGIPQGSVIGPLFLLFIYITGFDAEACWPLNGPLFSSLNPLHSHCILLWG